MSVSSTIPVVRKPLLSDRNYKVLKHTAAIGLPGLETLYFALANLWHFPDAEQVLGSIAAVNVFLGGFMGVSQKSYDGSDTKYDGDLMVGGDPTGLPTIQVAMNSEAAARAVLGKSEAKFKIVSQE